MRWIEDPIEALLADLRREMRCVLGEKLVGLILSGSLVSGDFDREISDIDLVAVTASPIDGGEFDRLGEVHEALVRKYPAWTDRLEIVYVPAEALRTFRSRPSTIAVISPGEPFHEKAAGLDWLIKWYVVRGQGVALEGPSPEEAIDPISPEEYRQAVRAQAEEWREWVYEMRERPGQAYAILTLCRALYAHRTGEQVSKRSAAEWAQGELPEWAPLIREAIRWREDYRIRGVDHAATAPETVRFVHAVADLIAHESAPRPGR